jgi:hypothetical protein
MEDAGDVTPKIISRTDVLFEEKDYKERKKP